jgi:hypothetical protein
MVVSGLVARKAEREGRVIGWVVNVAKLRSGEGVTELMEVESGMSCFVPTKEVEGSFEQKLATMKVGTMVDVLITSTTGDGYSHGNSGSVTKLLNRQRHAAAMSIGSQPTEGKVVKHLTKEGDPRPYAALVEFPTTPPVTGLLHFRALAGFRLPEVGESVTVVVASIEEPDGEGGRVNIRLSESAVHTKRASQLFADGQPHRAEVLGTYNEPLGNEKGFVVKVGDVIGRVRDTDLRMDKHPSRGQTIKVVLLASDRSPDTQRAYFVHYAKPKKAQVKRFNPLPPGKGVGGKQKKGK